MKIKKQTKYSARRNQLRMMEDGWWLCDDLLTMWLTFGQRLFPAVPNQMNFHWNLIKNIYRPILGHCRPPSISSSIQFQRSLWAIPDWILAKRNERFYRKSDKQKRKKKNKMRFYVNFNDSSHRMWKHNEIDDLILGIVRRIVVCISFRMNKISAVKAMQCCYVTFFGRAETTATVARVHVRGQKDRELI